MMNVAKENSSEAHNNGSSMTPNFLVGSKLMSKNLDSSYNVKEDLIRIDDVKKPILVANEGNK